MSVMPYATPLKGMFDALLETHLAVIKALLELKCADPESREGQVSLRALDEVVEWVIVALLDKAFSLTLICLYVAGQLKPGKSLNWKNPKQLSDQREQLASLITCDWGFRNKLRYLEDSGVIVHSSRYLAMDLVSEGRNYSIHKLALRCGYFEESHSALSKLFKIEPHCLFYAPLSGRLSKRGTNDEEYSRWKWHMESIFGELVEYLESHTDDEKVIEEVRVRFAGLPEQIDMATYDGSTTLAGPDDLKWKVNEDLIGLAWEKLLEPQPEMEAHTKNSTTKTRRHKGR